MKTFTEIILLVLAVWLPLGPIALLASSQRMLGGESRQRVIGGPFYWFRGLRGWLLTKFGDQSKVDVWLAFAAGLLVATILFFLTGCGKQEAAFSTGKVVQGYELPLPGFHGDSAYAAIPSTALPRFYENFRSVLSDQGLVKWDGRFDCNHFAALYVALAQSQFTVAAWHSETKAQTLALAEVWYLRGGVGTAGHAIVAAFTERGLVFVEPQTGRELELSAVERKSIYLCKW